MTVVTYKGNQGTGNPANTNRGPSPFLWADCPWSQYAVGDGGLAFFDDFVNFGVGATDALGSYKYYIDTSNTVTQLATEVGGVVRLLTDATDNDSPVLTTGGNTAGMVKLVSGGYPLWFEARVRVSSAALTECGIFVGLIEEGVAADNGVLSDNPDTNVATAMADKDYVGFVSYTNAAPTFSSAYKKAGGTDQVVDADSHTITLDEWVKLGIRHAPHLDLLEYYVNGILVGSVDVSGAGTTDFPSGEELALAVSIKNGAAAAHLFDLDWWRVAYGLE